MLGKLGFVPHIFLPYGSVGFSVVTIQLPDVSLNNITA
jgi:hypothetical protein